MIDKTWSTLVAPCCVLAGGIFKDLVINILCCPVSAPLRWLGRQPTGHSGGILCCSLHEELVVTGSSDCTIRVWDAKTAQVLHVLVGHQDTVTCVQTSGGLLISADASANIKFWDMSASFTLICTTDPKDGHDGAVQCLLSIVNMSLAPTSVLTYTGSDDHTIRAWQYENRACKTGGVWKGHTASVACLASDGLHLISASLDGCIRIWDNDGICIHEIRASAPIHSLYFAPAVGATGMDCYWAQTDSAFECYPAIELLYYQMALDEGHEGLITGLKFEEKSVFTTSGFAISLCTALHSLFARQTFFLVANVSIYD